MTHRNSWRKGFIQKLGLCNAQVQASKFMKKEELNLTLLTYEYYNSTKKFNITILILTRTICE
jgi:hypothetical protein